MVYFRTQFHLQKSEPKGTNVEQLTDTNNEPPNVQYRAPVFNYSQLFNHNNQAGSNSNHPMIPIQTDPNQVGSVQIPFASTLDQNPDATMSEETEDKLMQFLGPNSQQYPGNVGSGFPVQQGGPQSLFSNQGGPGLPVMPFQQGGPQLINQGNPGFPAVPFQQGGPQSINQGGPSLPFMPVQIGGPQFPNQGRPSLPFIPIQQGGPQSINQGGPFVPIQQGGPQSVNQGSPGLPFMPVQIGGPQSPNQGNPGLPFVSVQPGGINQGNPGLPFVPISPGGSQSNVGNPFGTVPPEPTVTQTPPKVPFRPPAPVVTPPPYKPAPTSNIFDRMYPQYGNQNNINSPFVNGPVRPMGIPSPNTLNDAYLVSRLLWS